MKIKVSNIRLTKKQQKRLEDEKARRAEKTRKEKEHNELLTTIQNKLVEDPCFIEDLKKIIDSTLKGSILDEVPIIKDGKPVVLKPVEELFNLLKPSFTTRPSLEEILSGQTIKKQQGNALYISPESVDMLFYPDVRNKIKEWQQEYFDVTLSGGKRDKAKDNILRVFTSLIYIGQGRQQEKALSSRDEAKIRLEFGKIDKSCREIFRQATRSLENRKLWINKKFPDVGEQIVKEGILDSLYLPERLRNIVFAKKYKCTERAIEECLRKWQVLKYDKLLTKEKAPITIRG